MTASSNLDADQAAMQKYVAELAQNPASQAFAPLAEIYRKQGRLQDALATCRAGLSKNPSYSGAQVLLAQILMDLKQPKAAEGELLGLIRRTPNHLLAHQVLLKLYSDYKMQPQAASIAQRILKLKPMDEAAQAVLSGQAWPATAPVAHAAPTNPGQPPLPTVTMAKLYEQQGHLEKALEIYNLLSKQQPQLAQEASRILELIGNKKKVAILNQLLVNIRQLRGHG